MKPIGLHGLVAAPHTPMTPDGAAVNLRAIEQQVQLLVDGGVIAAFVCGTTGEGASLTAGERKAVAERWVRHAPRSLPVIVHVGHASVGEARELAAHAQSIGARAFSTLAPFFFKPATVGDLVEFTAQVAGAAPDLPFYYYHLPSMTGVGLPMVDYFRQARQRIPNFVGIKFTHNDLMEFAQCVALAGDTHEVLFGRDEILLAGLVAGARGAIGSTYNYAAPVYQRVIEAFRAGNLAAAREQQAQALRLIEVLRKYSEIPAAKAITAMMGIDLGPARTPLPRLSAEQIDAIYTELHGFDIFTRPLRPRAVNLKSEI